MNRIPFGGEDIIYFRDLQDYHRLRALSEHGKNFLVIGGGFISSEIAAALTMIGKKVVIVDAFFTHVPIALPPVIRLRQGTSPRRS